MSFWTLAHTGDTHVCNVIQINKRALRSSKHAGAVRGGRGARPSLGALNFMAAGANGQSCSRGAEGGHLDDGTLPERHALNRQLGSEVAPCNHRAVHCVQDAVQALHSVSRLDLGQHLQQPSEGGRRSEQMWPAGMDAAAGGILRPCRLVRHPGRAAAGHADGARPRPRGRQAHCSACTCLLASTQAGPLRRRSSQAELEDDGG